MLKTHGQCDMGELAAIFILLAVVAFVIARLPSVEEVSHSDAFKRRRVMNWLPLGLTYAFLYMGRYNLKISKFAFEEMQDATGGALMGNADFGRHARRSPSKRGGGRRRANILLSHSP